MERHTVVSAAILFGIIGTAMITLVPLAYTTL